MTHFVNPTTSHLQNPNSRKHFVLVHELGHGAWCWYKLAPLLRSSGHNITSIDLAALGIDPKLVLDVPLTSKYFSPLIRFMDSLFSHEEAILVGHTCGGLAITQAMEKFSSRISCAIFDWTLATLLVRPSHVYGAGDQQRTIKLSSKNYGSVSRVSVMIDQDKVLKRYFQRWMIEQNPPDEVREIAGSDHMVMMSKTYELFVQLEDISWKYS
ncbi:hypothetical protein CDL12_13173 [Handroanthus impetiginosus]|uniref:AB hydrolase-1 domain-containing protein n=1 Tax=Handroanthus impetiginosus TaxID=429701 RepID=A0A2G9H9K3_9LAMI|nr:hypothetical protein CDL12_13173 [Handroanthus impetiginosus]